MCSNLFIFSGCATTSQKKVALPDWISNPSKNGVIGGVGYSATHIHGISGQRQLATERALEDIARQKGVLVNSVQLITSKSSNQTKIPNTTAKNISTFQSQQNVRAYIKEVWVHPVTKEMYIYMIAE